MLVCYFFTVLIVHVFFIMPIPCFTLQRFKLILELYQALYTCLYYNSIIIILCLYALT